MQIEIDNLVGRISSDHTLLDTTFIYLHLMFPRRPHRQQGKVRQRCPVREYAFITDFHTSNSLQKLESEPPISQR